MRSFGLKTLAILLTAAALVVLAGSAFSVVYLESENLYSRTPEELKRDRLEDMALDVSSYVVDLYGYTGNDTPEDDALGEAIVAENYWGAPLHLSAGTALYNLKSEDGTVLQSNIGGTDTASMIAYEFSCSGYTPVVVEAGSDRDLQLQNTFPAGEEDDYTDIAADNSGDVTPAAADAASVPETLLYDRFWEANDVTYHIYYFEGETYLVEVYLAQELWDSYYVTNFPVIERMYSHRNHFIAGVIGGAVLFLLGLIYLGWAVGRTRGSDEIRLTGLNRLPLDLYLVLAGGAAFLLGAATIALTEWAMDTEAVLTGPIALAAACAAGCALVGIVFYCALAAQMKIGDWYILRHSLLGRLARLLRNAAKWFFRGLAALINLLPLVWQWLLCAACMAVIVGIGWEMSHSPIPLLTALLICAGIVCYGAYCYGTLARGVRKLAAGELQHKISTRFLFGAFRDFARRLNTLADVAMVAAEKHMQSERMKTELITNVSHDIKTPLTSIINFVDLLQKPHSEEQGKEYLDVLSRQSQRMKKLIEDLMELSKANTGNIAVNIAWMDAVEVMNQALGEFADKLESAQLTPVVNQPSAPTPMLADGRLAWRVLSNLLSNTVKYALPGTRLYIDVIPLPGKVLMSMKNVSREQLNVSAEELMERFVRGDTARNTEGSGLGLNIARSLMEVQNGQLQLLVDGDLFKVTIVFPAEG